MLLFDQIKEPDHGNAELFVWRKKNQKIKKRKLKNSRKDLKNGYLVSSSFDKTIKIWENSFQLWQSTSDSHLKGILALKVKRNGDLVSSSQDGTIHF